MTLRADVTLITSGSDQLYRHNVEVVNSDTAIAVSLANTEQYKV